MKKLLVSIIAITTCISVNAQCNELFISQYVEGSGNNKALEIYNPSNDTIRMNNLYRLIRYANGQTEAAGNVTSNAAISLGTHVIGPHVAWVIVIDQRDTSGTGQNVAVVPALQAKADTFLCPNYAVSYAMYFNGNDALSLQKTPDGGTTWNDVDIFAQIGDAAMSSLDGTGGWSNVFPYDNALYESAWTYNHTLIRHPNVMQGVTVNPNPFIVGQQWDSLPENTFDSLGIHVCNCPTNAGIKLYDNTVSLQVYPNPSNSGFFTLTSTESILKVEVYNILGEELINKEGNKIDKRMVLQTAILPKGIYIIKASFDKGRVSTTKLSIQ